MIKKLTALLLVLAAVSTFHAQTSDQTTYEMVGSYLSKIQFRPSWGFHPAVYHWDQVFGNTVALEGGYGPFHLNYAWNHYSLGNFSFAGDSCYHRLGLGAAIPLGRFVIDPGFSLYWAGSSDTLVTSFNLGAEYQILRFARRGDYTHSLSARLESNLNFRLHLAAGISYTRRWAPLPPIDIKYVVAYVDRDQDYILSGYEEAAIGIRFANYSKNKASYIRATVTSVNSKGHPIETTPVEITDLAGESYVDEYIYLKSTDQLYNGSAEFVISLMVIDQADKSYTGQYSLKVPTESSGRPTMPPQLTAKVSFADVCDRDGFLDGGESNFITVTLKNEADTRAFNLRVLVTAEELVDGVKFQRELVIPAMEKQYTARIPISADKTVKDGQVRLKIEVKEPFYGANADPKILIFETRRLLTPVLEVVQHGVEEEIIQAGQHSHVSMVVQNNGGGLSQATTVSVDLPPGVNLIGRESTEWSLGDLKPGEWRRVDMTLFLSKDYNEDQLKFDVKVKETRVGSSTLRIIRMPVGVYVAKVDETTVTGYEESGTGTGTPVPVLTSDVDTLALRGKDSRPDAIAVIIYVKDYKAGGVPTVKYADRDAHTMRKYVTELLGYSDSNVIFLANPTKGELEQVFGLPGQPHGRRLDSWIRPGTTPEVFVYYVGHGAPSRSGDAYIVPSDCAPDAVETGGYPIDALYDNVTALDIKKATVVIDACFSGQTQEGMIVSGASPIMMSKMPDAHLRDDGKLTILAAARGDEFASWYDEQRHSMFTYYFLKGLSGKADDNSDNTITLGEMEAYLGKEIPYIVSRKYPGRKQTPDVKGDMNQILVRYR